MTRGGGVVASRVCRAHEQQPSVAVCDLDTPKGGLAVHIMADLGHFGVSVAC